MGNASSASGGMGGAVGLLKLYRHNNNKYNASQASQSPPLLKFPRRSSNPETATTRTTDAVPRAPRRASQNLQVKHENANQVQRLLFELDALPLQVDRTLGEASGGAGGGRTDVVRATIPHAVNGRASMVRIVDRHQTILTKQEHSKLYHELTCHVHLATKFCQWTQHDPAYADQFQYLPKVQELQNPCLVRLYGHFMHNRTLHMLTEYCQHGSLASVLAHDARFQETHKKRLVLFHGEKALKVAVAQLCAGVSFMHASELAHTNLSLENVFASDSGNILIGDFKDAVAVVSGGGGENAACCFVMPLPPAGHCHHGPFTAPERYAHNSGGGGGGHAGDNVTGAEQGKVAVDLVKADAWSTGMVIFAMVTRQQLFKAASLVDPAFQSFKQLGFAAYYKMWVTKDFHRQDECVVVPHDIQLLLGDLLDVNPVTRASVTDVIQRYAWLRKENLIVREMEPSDWKLVSG